MNNLPRSNSPAHMAISPQYLYPDPYQSLPVRGGNFPHYIPLPLLQAVVDEAENNIMAPRPLILMGALTAVSLVLQGLFDVCKPSGQCVPTSIMLLAVANSGERKSTAENIFLNPIRLFQKQQKIIFQEKLMQWQAQFDVWDSRRRSILRCITNDAAREQSSDDDEQLLLIHERRKPVRPKEFKMLYEDATSEALFHGLYQNLPTAGLTSSEGGGVLGGRAFNDLSKMNAIWSGDTITIDRKSSASFELADARLAVSIMAQESAVSEYMERRGEKSRGSGLWGRFLVFHPVSTQGSRINRGHIQSWGCRDKFAERLTEFLKQNIALLNDAGFERTAIKFTPEASERWLFVSNAIEGEIRTGGRFYGAGDHASKLADNIARVAALFHSLEGFEGDIKMATLNVAIDVCFWCSDEFIKLFMPPPQEQVDALELNFWIARYRDSGRRYIRKNYILQYGPNKFRVSARLNAALFHLDLQRVISIWRIGRFTYIDLFPHLPVDQQLIELTASGGV
jgi:hypothetical protein